jgi:hypothetical protein
MIDKYNKGDILLITMEEFIMNNKDNVFRYYNCNPHHKRTDDCVVRSIAAGTGDSWEDTAKGLFNEMMSTGYAMGCQECYGVYLKKKGWVKQKQVVRTNGKKVRVGELAKKFNGHIILHVGQGHCSYVADGCVWDIWDCSNEVAGSLWVPQEEISDFTRMREEFK